MTRIGTAAATGHHVLCVSPGPSFDTQTGARRRPDTPSPPCRLFTERPALLEDTSDDDVSMPPASPIDEAPSSPLDDDNANPPLPVCAPLPQEWIKSNARLEKLQASAQRCAASAKSDSNNDGVPGFVFATESPEAMANQQNTADVESSTGAPDSERMDTDESVIDKKRVGEIEATSAFSRHGSGCGPETGRGRASSVSSSLSSLSLASTNGHDFELVALPSSGNEAEESQLFRNHPTPLVPDCHSTIQSPASRPLFLDNSDAESLPSLCELPSEHESPNEEGPERPLFSANTTSITSEKLNAQIERIARPPSTPANHDWPLTAHWTHNQSTFVTRVREAQHADALALLRQAVALVERFSEILDTASMQANQHVETDLINEIARVDASGAGCADFAQRVQSIRDTVNAYSPGLVDDSPIHNITSIPVALDGSHHRLLSPRALAQPLSYRYALYILARHYPDWIGAYTLLRKRVTIFLGYLEDLFKQRGWTLDQELLHRPAPVPLPYLKPNEYSRFRIFLYTFELHGCEEVARVMGDFLRYRFQEPEIVSHLLHAGAFDPHDIHLHSANGEAFITRRTAPPSYRASPEVEFLFHDADSFRQKRPRFSLRRLESGESAAGH
ncbi:hypothetical protein C8R47DRAFT_1230060 [Mycena vitilis]|nr:hypothetical protein C8R47DRAFT_1230060 [Mycena vitilis]